MNEDIFIQVYIATHNRTDYLMESVNSVLNQDYPFFEVIVSDNSTNDETEKLFFSFKHPKLVYKRRNACSASKHFNLIINEASACYFMMFHDDDIMFYNMLSTYSNYINQNSGNISAIGSNAWLLKGKRKTKNLYGKANFRGIKALNFENLARLCLKNNIIATFPSYIYNLKTIRDNNIFIKGDSFGKYADVTLLLEIANIKDVLNIGEPLMYYRTHENNDSNINDFNSRLKLIGFIKDNIETKKNDKDILSYRLYNIYSELLTRHYRIVPSKKIAYKRLYKTVKLFFKNNEHKLAIKIVGAQILILFKIIKRRFFKNN